MDPTQGVSLAVLLVGAGGLFCLIPVLTRRDLFFAVTVSPSFPATAEGRGILASFRREVLAHTVIAAVGGFLLARLGWAMMAPLMSAWLLVGFLHAFLRSRRRARAHAVAPPSQYEASLEPRDPLPGGRPVQMGPFVLIALVALVLVRNWARLPQSIPTHWNWQGQPGGWAALTPAFAVLHLALAAALCALFVFIAWLVGRRSRIIHLHGPAGGAERHFRRAVMTLLLMSEYLLAITFPGVLLLPLVGPRGHFLVWALPAFALAIAVAAILWLFRLGQGGSRAARAAGAAPVGDRTSDRYWKLGMFYFNPEDPALMVEKRFGLGYTFNFGHPAGWVIVGVAVVAFLLGAGHRFHRLL